MFSSICIIFLVENVQIPLQWSEKLDEVFLQNYRSDPSLSWQYFGSTAGFMRHYPGKTRFEKVFLSFWYN